MRLVPVRLCDLVIGEEFVMSLTRRAGRVLAFGHVRPRENNPERTRIHSALVAYGTEQKIHRAEMTVLVSADRTHRRISDEVGDMATRRAVGPRRQVVR